MKQGSSLLLLLIVLLFSCQKEKTYNRTDDVWVFRSVLDQKTRILTIGLNDELWVAYNTQCAQLYKAWKGGVKFDGAVYTTSHGPQPTAEGYAYFINDSSTWVLRGSGDQELRVQHRGHKFIAGQIVIMYDLISEGRVISVEETPEYIQRGKQTGISRDFKVLGLMENEKLVLKTVISSLQKLEDYKTKGAEIKVIKETDEVYDNGVITNVNVELAFANGSAQLKVFYHPGFDKIATNIPDTKEEIPSELPKGAHLIEQSDCATCHNAELKTVGPSYLAVAKKYSESESQIASLADKVINGGSGVWGVVAMSPHPDLQEEDAKEMIRYILTLDDGAGHVNTWDKLTLAEKSRPIKLVDNFSGKDGQGLMVNYYRLFEGEDDDVEEVLKNKEPIRNGPVSNIHTLGDDFDLNTDRFVVEYSGYLTINKEDNYGFRLVNNDNAWVYINDELVVSHPGKNKIQDLGTEVYLKPGKHKIKVIHKRIKGWTIVSFQWFNKESMSYELIPDNLYTYEEQDIKPTAAYVPLEDLVKSIPGDQQPVAGVHPSFDLFQAHPSNFDVKVGGIDFLSDGRMVICTWDSLGPVYIIDNYLQPDHEQIKVKRIATGLAEPLGIQVVDDQIYVLQKQELTRLVDKDGDDIIDEYQTVSNDWRVSANFHEFAFGLEYKDGYFYGALATAIMPGGASANPQIPDRGKVVKISKEDGSVEFVAHGLRTPNGVGTGIDGGIFVADNQGDWLPSSKIVEVQGGEWFGSRSVDFEGTANLTEALPVVWLPQDEIGNSPSEPIYINVGPYQNQMIHGEVTHGGIKRVFAERVEGRLQGAVFRFTQGLEAGVNRLDWAPGGSLMVGGVGNPGNWSHAGRSWFGLQRLNYNNTYPFEMLSVSARTNGFEITFTEAIAEGQNIVAEDFKIQQWYYKPTSSYGGPKLDLETLTAKKFALSQDRKTIFIELEGLKENHVVYFRIIRPFVSQSDQELWTTEAWYTLNKIPLDKPGFTNQYTVIHNTLSQAEKEAGWKLLFDGETTGRIRNFNSESLGSAWKVKDGTLALTGKEKGETGWQSSKGGDIVISDREYQNYELRLDWKVAKNGNSGIIYKSKEGNAYSYAWNTGLEMQILDNVGHPDGQIKMHRAGDLYDILPSRFVTVNESEEWNRIRLIVKDDKIEHWQNGYKVVEADMKSPEWKEWTEKSKFNEMNDYGKAQSGHIVLQDHGDRVWFRNIKIKELE